jgi:hypothetical protein
MQKHELPGIASDSSEPAHLLKRLAIEYVDTSVASVGRIQILLSGVGRKRD